jgi:sugar-phosphatase
VFSAAESRGLALHRPRPPTPASQPARRAVLLDVDGTLLDVVANQRRIWDEWARRHRMDADQVWRAALGTRAPETFAALAPGLDPAACIAALNEIESEDVRDGEYAAFAGAHELLTRLPAGSWALITSNYESNVRGRFEREGLPLPGVVVDAEAVTRGKPDPEGYVTAARRLAVPPACCLVVEDGETGMRAGRAADMTVWAVNAEPGIASAGGAHREFAALGDAVDEILAWCGVG